MERFSSLPVCHEIRVKYYIILHKFFFFFADSSLLKTVDGAHLECVIKNHPALVSMMHLLPENVLVSGDENIPGLAASPTGKLYITQKVLGQRMSNLLPYFTSCSFKIILRSLARLEDL